MTAFFVATSRIKDSEKFAEYGAKAAGTFPAFGGTLVIRGKADQALAGHSDHQAVGVVRFPDMESLNNWYQSNEYQALIPLREEAADMTLVSYGEIT